MPGQAGYPGKKTATTDRRTKMSSVKYAETELLVHEVYEEALELHGFLDAALARQSSVAQQARAVASKIDAREYALAEAARADDPKLSQEALKRKLRDAAQTDGTLRALHREQLEIQNEQEVRRYEIDTSRYRLRILTARMEQLGGLLNFYAAAKMRASTTSTSEPLSH